MSLQVVSLSSLASKVVLAQNLDTRELPRHLHRQMEQYMRLRGDFTLLSVDFQVERADKQAVTEEDRRTMVQWLQHSTVGAYILASSLIIRRNDMDSWTARRYELSTPVTFLEDPVVRLDTIQACIEDGSNVTTYMYGYLENGKLLYVEKIEKLLPKIGKTVITSNHGSIEIDDTDSMVWVQKLENPPIGLVYTVTVKATRRVQLAQPTATIATS